MELRGCLADLSVALRCANVKECQCQCDRDTGSAAANGAELKVGVEVKSSEKWTL